MSAEIAVAIVTGGAIVIAAIVKFVPQKNRKNTCPPALCSEHSGVVERLKSGDSMFESINNRLGEIEKENKDMQKMIFEIHGVVMKH